MSNFKAQDVHTKKLRDFDKEKEINALVKDKKHDEAKALIEAYLNGMAKEYKDAEYKEWTYKNRKKQVESQILDQFKFYEKQLLDSKQSIEVDEFLVGYNNETTVTMAKRFDLIQFIEEYGAAHLKVEISRSSAKTWAKTPKEVQLLKAFGVRVGTQKKYYINNNPNHNG